LNFQFVSGNQDSARQIFSLLPPGIAYGLNIDVNQVVLRSLNASDTVATLGYFTTLAMAYIPSSYVNALSLDIHTPPSLLYNNPDHMTNVLMNTINPSIPILAGGAIGGSPPGSGTGPSTATVSAIITEGAPLGGAENSSSIKGTSVGIGVAVVAGAAVYGAAMFFVAQRYKKRRQLHRRSSSIIDTSSMAQTHSEIATGAGAALMSGGRGGSAGDYGDGYGYGYSGRNSRGSGHTGGSSGRQQISAPVMAENSLGWN